MHNSWSVKVNLNTWGSATVEELFYVKGRIGWRGLRRSQFTDHGPYLITGMHISEGKVQWDDCFHISEDKFQESPEIIVEVGDIIITKDGTIGKVAYIDYLPGPTSLNSHLFLVRPKVSRVDRRFAYHVFTSGLFNQHINDHRTGSTISGLSEKLFLRFDLPLPFIQEQRLIADILDTIDTQIEHTEQLITKLKIQKAGLFQDLLTCGLDEHGQLRNPISHPERFKNSALGRIPKEWEVASILNHVSLPEGQVDPRLYPFCDWPLIAPDHIESGTGRLICIETAAQQNAISGKYCFLPGDVLYSKIRPYLRKAVLADREGLCSADMYPLRPKNTMNSHFLLATILGERFSRFATAVSTRSGFPKINRNELSEYMLALPPLQEQEAIANIFVAFDASIRTEEAHLDKLKLYKESLIQALLAGRAHVNIAEKRF